MGRDGVMLTSMNSFLLLVVFTSVTIFGENRSRYATMRVQTDREIHRHKDANQFYHLSHAIYCGYRADNYQ